MANELSEIQEKYIDNYAFLTNENDESEIEKYGFNELSFLASNVEDLYIKSFYEAVLNSSRVLLECVVQLICKTQSVKPLVHYDNFGNINYSATIDKIVEHYNKSMGNKVYNSFLTNKRIANAGSHYEYFKINNYARLVDDAKKLIENNYTICLWYYRLCRNVDEPYNYKNIEEIKLLQEQQQNKVRRKIEKIKEENEIYKRINKRLKKEFDELEYKLKDEKNRNVEFGNRIINLRKELNGMIREKIARKNTESSTYQNKNRLVYIAIKDFNDSSAYCTNKTLLEYLIGENKSGSVKRTKKNIAFGKFKNLSNPNRVLQEILKFLIKENHIEIYSDSYCNKYRIKNK